MRGIFFTRDTAEVVSRLLTSDGYAAEVVAEPCAGEDDDADHAWAVLTDAPQIALELLVDAYEGWLEADEVGPARPLDLPTAPKQRHRPPPRRPSPGRGA